MIHFIDTRALPTMTISFEIIISLNELQIISFLERYNVFYLIVQLIVLVYLIALTMLGFLATEGSSLFNKTALFGSWKNRVNIGHKFALWPETQLQMNGNVALYLFQIHYVSGDITAGKLGTNSRSIINTAVSCHDPAFCHYFSFPDTPFALEQQKPLPVVCEKVMLRNTACVAWSGCLWELYHSLTC